MTQKQNTKVANGKFQNLQGMKLKMKDHNNADLLP
jgi:hypothetical protein